jgi:hypothetical protein
VKGQNGSEKGEETACDLIRTFDVHST